MKLYVNGLVFATLSVIVESGGRLAKVQVAIGVLEHLESSRFQSVAQYSGLLTDLLTNPSVPKRTERHKVANWTSELCLAGIYRDLATQARGDC